MMTKIKKMDMILIIFCSIVSIISVLLLYSISSSFMISKKVVIVQIMASFIGIIVAIFISTIDYHTIANLWKFYVPITIFFVILTFFIGSQRGNADDKAWIMLPFGVSFQPSEFLKISFIVSFSLHLNSIGCEINDFKNVILLFFHGFVPIFLIHLQGDDGAALMFAIIFIFMIFSAGLSWKYILSGLSVLCIMFPLIWKIMNKDQQMRILVMMNPAMDPTGIGYQQLNGLISIGNGGLIGKGLFENKYLFVPEIKNDFIFSFVGQSIGYIGSVLVLGILIFICIKVLIIGLKSDDYIGKYICVGVFSMMIAQIIFNIGMNLSVLPVIGITLPLLSSGGSSIVTVYLGIGLVLSVYYYNNKKIFI